jgi:hypothetical protein
VKSLHELRDELLGIRLAAVNNSLFRSQVLLTEAARIALNDAIRTYEFTVTKTHQVTLPSSGRGVFVMPADVTRIVAVKSVGGTYGEVRRERVGIEYRATDATKLLYLDAAFYAGPTNCEVIYEKRVTELPSEGAIIGTLAAGVTAIAVTGAIPAATWRSPGVLAIHAVADTDLREIVMYNSVTISGFEGCVRNWGGQQTITRAIWPEGSIVSPVLEAPDLAMPVIMHAAQAEMYHFWVRQRALYEQVMQFAAFQQLDVSDLLGLVRSEEDRADRRYKRVKHVPEPSHVERKRVRR